MSNGGLRLQTTASLSPCWPAWDEEALSGNRGGWAWQAEETSQGVLRWGTMPFNHGGWVGARTHARTARTHAQTQSPTFPTDDFKPSSLIVLPDTLLYLTRPWHTYCKQYFSHSLRRGKCGLIMQILTVFTVKTPS